MHTTSGGSAASSSCASNYSFFLAASVALATRHTYVRVKKSWILFRTSYCDDVPLNNVEHGYTVHTLLYWFP